MTADAKMTREQIEECKVVVAASEYDALRALATRLMGDVERLTEALKKEVVIREIWRDSCGKEQDRRIEAERRAEAAEARYEYVRRLNVRQFADLYNQCLRGAAFDSQVDAAIAAAKDAK